MKIIIKIDGSKITLILKKGEVKVDNFSWEEKQNLSQRLLVEIDNLLRKNSLTPEDVENVKVKTDIDEKFTTVRIAKVVANTFNNFKNNDTRVVR